MDKTKNPHSSNGHSTNVWDVNDSSKCPFMGGAVEYTQVAVPPTAIGGPIR